MAKYNQLSLRNRGYLFVGTVCLIIRINLIADFKDATKYFGIIIAICGMAFFHVEVGEE